MSRYTLYWRPGSGSMAVEAALRLSGADFEGVRIEDEAGLRDPEFLALNPAGMIPILLLPSGQILTESAAILLALDELHPQAGLLPPRASPERRKAVQWLIFMAANIYPAARRYYYPARHTADTSEAAIKAVRARAASDMDRDFAQLMAAIDGPFLLGRTMTITDVYAAMLADWHAPATELPRIQMLISHMLENDAVSTAWSNHRFGS